ncbi:hypothetical protein MIDIC_230155 [Alphaproteobacteria bacterium]
MRTANELTEEGSQNAKDISDWANDAKIGKMRALPGSLIQKLVMVQLGIVMPLNT